MRRDQFNAFLETLETVGAPAAALCGVAGDVEKALGFNLDNAELSADSIEAMVARAVAGNPALKAEACRDALKAYGRFSAYYKAR